MATVRDCRTEDELREVEQELPTFAHLLTMIRTWCFMLSIHVPYYSKLRDKSYVEVYEYYKWCEGQIKEQV